MTDSLTEPPRPKIDLGPLSSSQTTPMSNQECLPKQGSRTLSPYVPDWVERYMYETAMFVGPAHE